MAICNALNGGISKSCDNNAGGVKKIWIGDFDKFTFTTTNSEITNIYNDLSLSTNLITTSGTVLTDVVAGVVVTTNVEVTGDQTSKFVAGSYVKFTYSGQFGNGYWYGPVTSSSYNAGTNKTTIVPNYTDNFAPVLGTSGSVPSNANNQSVYYGDFFFEFEFNRGTSNYNESLNINLQNGTSYFTQTAVLVLSRREKAKAEAIKALTAGQKKLVIIVLDSNGLYWAFGKDDGMVVTAIEGGSGTAKADANNYVITFTGEESENAPEVNSTVLTPFIF
jgi:hypothetical protein